MEKNNVISKEKGVYKKIFAAISMSPGFKTRHRLHHREETETFHQPKHQPTCSVRSSTKFLGSPDPAKHSGFIPIIFEAPSTTPNLTEDVGAHVTGSTAQNEKVRLRQVQDKVSTNVSPKIEHVRSGSRVLGKPKTRQERNTTKKNGTKMEKTRIEGADLGSEKSRVKGAVEHTFSEYIDRAGSKIRAASNVVGLTKSGLSKDSFENKVSDYINRTRLRFKMPSFVDN